MPPVVVAVAAGVSAGVFAAGTVAISTAVLIGGAVAAATVALQKSLTPEMPAAPVTPEQAQDVTTAANQPRYIVYGEAVIGGRLVGYSKVKDNNDNTDFHVLVIHIAGHASESLQLLEINGKAFADVAADVEVEYHLGDQTTVSPTALFWIDDWTEEFIGLGQTYAVIKSNVEIGVDGIKFLCKGKKVYDPRKDTTEGGSGAHRYDDPATWEWSSNPELIAVDWVRHHGARPQPKRRIPLDFVAAAANYCDENVLYKNKDNIQQAEKRFNCNGVLHNEMAPGEGLKAIMSSMGAKPIRIGGKFYIKPAMYTGPAVKTIEADLGAMLSQYRPHSPERERCNTVRAQFVDPAKRYQMTDAKPVVNAAKKAADGGEIAHDIRLTMTYRPTVAQRLARIHLEKTLNAFKVEHQLPGIHLDLNPGMHITFTDSQSGISKEFEVEQVNFNARSNTTDLSLVADSPEFYVDDPNVAESAPPVNSTLPTALTTPPSGLAFTDVYNGVQQVRVDWVNPFFLTQIIVEQVGTGLIVYEKETAEKTVFLSGLDTGDYTITLRAVDRLGRLSPKLSAQPFTITAQPDHVWKVYADDSAGTGISTTDDSKPFVGYAHNRTSAIVDTNNPAIFGFFPNTAAQFLIGTGEPGAQLGNVGDTYINQTTGDIYQKTGAGWGSPVGNFAPGDGDRWLSGAGVPNNANGSDGDWYINTTDYDLYQRVAGAWEPRGTIQGANGLTPYVHIAYADSADGTTGFSFSTGGDYRGEYTDFNADASTDPALYTWVKVKGDTGQDGTDGVNADAIVSTELTRWGFNDGTLQGFNGYDGTLSAIGTYLKFTVNGPDPRIYGPSGQAVDGGKYYAIRVRIRTTSPDHSDTLAFYYETAGHLASANYRSEKTVNYKTGEWQYVTVDMRELTAGGTDYIDNTITRFRFDPAASNNGYTYEIDEFTVGFFGASDQTDYTDDRISNEQITGANLLKKSIWAGLSYGTGYPFANEYIATDLLNDDTGSPVQPGDVVTISADIRLDAAAVAAGVTGRIYIYTHKSNGAWTNSSAISTTSTTWERKSVKMTIPDDGESVSLAIGAYHMPSSNATGLAFIRRVKVEQGPIATKYAPPAIDYDDQRITNEAVNDQFIRDQFSWLTTPADGATRNTGALADLDDVDLSNNLRIRGQLPAFNAEPDLRNSGISIGSNGALAGAGGGSVTISGLGYSGALNANYVSDGHIDGRANDRADSRIGTLRPDSTYKNSNLSSGDLLSGAGWSTLPEDGSTATGAASLVRDPSFDLGLISSNDSNNFYIDEDGDQHGGPALRIDGKTRQNNVYTWIKNSTQRYLQQSARIGDRFRLRIRAKNLGNVNNTIGLNILGKDASNNNTEYLTLFRNYDIPNDGQWHTYEGVTQIANANTDYFQLYFFATTGFTTGSLLIDNLELWKVPDAIDNSTVSIGSNGMLAGAGGGQVSIYGLGYSGALNANYVSDGHIDGRANDRIGTMRPDSTYKNNQISISSSGTLSGAGGGAVSLTGLGGETPANAQIKADNARASAIATVKDDPQVVNNRLDLSEWRIGTTGSRGRFSQNGQTDENRIVRFNGPYGYKEPVWECDGNDDSNDGGWNYTNIPVDTGKSYRLSVWARQSGSTNGAIYFGCHDAETLTGNLNTNPYFWAGDLPQLDRWYLLVGIINAEGETAGAGISGIYDGVTGARVVHGTEYRHKPGITTQIHRAYLYYSDGTETARFARPRFDEINGNEPSITELLSPANEYIIDGRADSRIGSLRPNSNYKNNQISIGSNGVLSGAGGGQVSISGLGYSGALNANYVSDGHIDGRANDRADSRIGTLRPDASYKNNQISIGSNGALSGAGGGSVTISGLGYSGSLNANYVSDTHIDTRATSRIGALRPDGSYKNNQISIGSNGTLSGAGGGSVTISGLGYSGSLNANYVSDTHIEGRADSRIGSLRPNSSYKNNQISVSSNGVLNGAGGGQVTLGGIGFTGATNANYVSDSHIEGRADSRITITRPHSDYKNANTTKAQVGLSLVENKSSTTLKNEAIAASKLDSLLLNKSGSGANFFNANYATPDPDISFSPSGNVSSGYVSTWDGYAQPSGGNVIRIDAGGPDAYLYLGKSSTDYNTEILPRRKWLVSYWVYSASTNKAVQLYIRASNGTFYALSGTTHSGAYNWKQIRGVIDMTGNASDRVVYRLDNDGGSGVNVIYDHIMVEPYIEGNADNPSEYAPPLTERRLRDQRNIPMINTAGALASVNINPLSAADIGFLARIYIASHTLRLSTGSITYNYGEITVDYFNRRYYIYCDDPDYVGGAQTYVATENITDITDNAGRRYVGTVRTPSDGGGSTGGDCVFDQMWLTPTLQAKDAQAGDLIDVWDVNRKLWKAPIQRIIKGITGECISIKSVSGCVVTCSLATPMTRADGTTYKAINALNEKVYVSDEAGERWEDVESVTPAGDLPIVRISVGDISFAAGTEPARRIVTHNGAEKP